MSNIYDFAGAEISSHFLSNCSVCAARSAMRGPLPAMMSCEWARVSRSFSRSSSRREHRLGFLLALGRNQRLGDVLDRDAALEQFAEIGQGGFEVFHWLRSHERKRVDRS